MPSFFPWFLLAAGCLLMWQPRTRRWRRRVSARLGGDERRVNQRANTFFLLGFAFVLAGLAFLFRSVKG